MIVKESIRNFEICRDFTGEYDRLEEKALEKDIISFIQKESDTGNLFQKGNWRESTYKGRDVLMYRLLFRGFDLVVKDDTAEPHFCAFAPPPAQLHYVKKEKTLSRKDSWHWDEFLEKGEEWYSYLTKNYPSMISEWHIPHFNIIPGLGCDMTHKELMKEHGKDIETGLCQWIENELSLGNLMKKENWSPFSDEYDPYEMYLGYKRFYIHAVGKKYYYLQLGIVVTCNFNLVNVCNDCVNSKERNPHFIVAYCGWREEGESVLKPYNFIGITDNSDWIPEKYWEV